MSRSHVGAVLVLATGPFVGFFACGGAQGKVDSPMTEASASASSEPIATHKEPVALPGDCVDPVVDGERHDPTRAVEKKLQLEPRNDDLDDDGVSDFFVEPTWVCGGNCMRSVYVARGRCGHYVGTFASSKDIRRLTEVSHGLHDLQVSPESMGENGPTCYRVVLSFDGTTYAPKKHRECKCDAPSMCEPEWHDGAP